MPRSWWCRACNYNWLFVDETTWKGKNRRKGHLVIILYIKTMIACTAMTKSSTVSNIFPLQQYISSPITKSQCLYTIAKEADVSGTVISYIDADTFLNPLYWSKLSEKDTKVIKKGNKETHNVDIECIQGHRVDECTITRSLMKDARSTYQGTLRCSAVIFTAHKRSFCQELMYYILQQQLWW